MLCFFHCSTYISVQGAVNAQSTSYNVQLKSTVTAQSVLEALSLQGGKCWKSIKQLWCIGETFSRQGTAKCQQLNLVVHCCQWLSRTLKSCSLYEAVQRCSLLQYFRVYSVHCTIQCNLICILQSTLYSTVYTLLYPTLYTILYSLYSVHYPLGTQVIQGSMTQVGS